MQIKLGYHTYALFKYLHMLIAHSLVLCLDLI